MRPATTQRLRLSPVLDAHGRGHDELANAVIQPERLLKTLLRIIIGITAVALTLVACAPATTEPQPPDIAYGQDTCNACGMIISDPHFASATLLHNGEYLKFDDIGDMFTYHMDHPDAQVQAWFVHDYNSQAWIRAETALYVQSVDLDTPMGHGLAAFNDQASAEAFSQQFDYAQVLNFDEARAEMHMLVHGR